MQSLQLLIRLHTRFLQHLLSALGSNPRAFPGPRGWSINVSICWNCSAAFASASACHGRGASPDSFGIHTDQHKSIYFFRTACYGMDCLSTFLRHCIDEQSPDGCSSLIRGNRNVNKTCNLHPRQRDGSTPFDQSGPSCVRLWLCNCYCQLVLSMCRCRWPVDDWILAFWSPLG